MIVNFTVVPLGESAGLSRYVARALRIVSESGLKYHFHSMGTVIEGEWDEVMGVVKRCHDTIRALTPRVLTTVQIDDREGATGAIVKKRRAVENIIGKELD